MKIAFSTTICPGWTLDQAIQSADDLGYLGLEMRSFSPSNDAVCCDPQDLEPQEVAHKFNAVGITPLSLATSIRYDKPIFPPVIGRVFQNEEEGVEDTKQSVDFAAHAGIKYVRVYGYQLPQSEPRAWGDKRVGTRLMLASQTARNTDTRILIENAGSYARASDLLDLLNAFPNPFLAVSYNPQASILAGECPLEALALLKDHIHTVRLVDHDEEHNPTLLGQGDLPNKQIVDALNEMGFAGWIVYEYPKLWVPEDARNPHEVLKHAADTLYEWIQSDTDDASAPSCEESHCACAH